MASYVVLARKWRPAQFSDIVGQGPVVRTLMNAIRANRIHQAYLFTGSRGIGKTSIARIFAKVVRCENTKWENNSLRSCDECSCCKEVTLGNSVDVIEIDGASNNGVDHVREIRENAKYLPASGGRKIYIIDEVHMLSTQAFNALLKTLEEPPAHVIFIFATTEPHKIPATILSRCQRFDLKRVAMAQIQVRLTEVTQAEGIQAEPAALALVARAAEGGMRDALSLLDQVIAFSGDQITVQTVRDSIGLVEGQTLLGILSGVMARKPLEALALVEQAYQQGHDLRVLTRSLIEFLHGAILAKIGAPASATLELAEPEWKELQAIAAMRSLEEIELIFQVLNHGIEWIIRSPQPKIVLDVLLVKCATAEALIYAGEGQGLNQNQPPIQNQAQKQVQKLTPPAELKSTPTPIPAAPTAILNWETFIGRIRETRPLLATVLEHGTCTKLPSETEAMLLIHFRPEDSYYREQLQARAYNDQLLALSKEFFGRHVQLKVELASEEQQHEESVATRRDREHKERERTALQKAQNHPIIREAQSLFGGDLGPIEVLEPSSGVDQHARA